MTDSILLAAGVGIFFLFLGGAYVYLRQEFQR